MEDALAEASKRFGLALPAGGEATLVRFLGELLRWNRSVNLTSIEEPAAVGELHLLDSLAVVKHVPQGARVADVGTGGGFPGVPLAVARPDLRVELLDRTEKKILFLKTTLARLGIGNAQARHVRLEGRPAAEGLGPYDVAISRAFTAPAEWIRLARQYVRPGGRVITMLGADRPDPAVWSEALGDDELIGAHDYTLPSGARRGIWVVQLR
ncbi:16S rRNA (guanine(527)-N(7))-methyltransferase RsmG [Vulgatibacter sp.]|uniref:16S rRNA (guanine(527)-N(7))-methyltransferase RsmG n=1 Tax=Vulgatibacter sp. TaxID=1971226 RepID=UPI0035625CE9